MRIFNWLQGKIDVGKQEKKVAPACPISARYKSRTHATTKEEFSDWPKGLLEIGTFGNSTGRKGDRHNDNVNPTTPPLGQLTEQLGLTVDEEVDKLQKELARLLAFDGGKPGAVAEVGKSCGTAVRRSRPSGTEIDVTTSLHDGGGDGKLSPKSRVILSRAKEVLAENRNNLLNQRSFSFLLKKMFACGSDHVPSPSFRDQLQPSITEKIIKAIVQKKIYPQNAAPVSSSGRKHLEKKKQVLEEDKTKRAKADDGSKWVKTDSEFIVLEM